MIEIVFESAGLERALEELPGRIRARAIEGVDATCEAIAARARETRSYTDRTGLLRASTQNAGATEQGQDIVGIVSFAARSRRGFPYGVVVNARKRFIDDAFAAQDGSLFEAAIARAFRDAGLSVGGA